jgi:hypothetical protein
MCSGSHVCGLQVTLLHVKGHIVEFAEGFFGEI